MCWSSEVFFSSANTKTLHYQVPKMIDYYNKYMHAVDVFDQIRKMFGVDLTHKTFKYTVRVFEILFSMILAQAYNIHRELHGNNQHRKWGHFSFKCSIVRGLLRHPVVQAPAVQHFNEHRLVRTEPASDGPDRGNRRRLGECRVCPRHVNGARNGQRRTYWFCPVCNMYFHPQCFSQWPAHSLRTPTRNVRPRTGNTGT